jgi:hypothetical protein
MQNIDVGGTMAVLQGFTNVNVGGRLFVATYEVRTLDMGMLQSNILTL